MDQNRQRLMEAKAKQEAASPALVQFVRLVREQRSVQELELRQSEVKQHELITYSFR